MTIYLIRHGKTAGNLEKRYIGRTDEPLCEAGIAELKARRYPDCDIVIASPMLRCMQTAGIIYPGKEPVTYNDLRECDFGDFEGRNHIEMNGDPVYQAWIDKGGMAPFPGGEDSTDFRRRSINGFLKALSEHSGAQSAAFVVHGGTIMSVLEGLAVPHKEFYEYMTENGRGRITVYDGEKLTVTGEI